jgi:multimeric flavodoxin WrbA
MRIAILNGEPNPLSEFQRYVCEVAHRLSQSGHAVTQLDLRDLELKGCSGCFGCWVKTPGECLKRDDSAQVCRCAIEADLVLMAAPVKMGFTSALLKRATDQMIPLIHPYFVFEGGEVHHRARYARYPKFGLLMETSACDAEDVEIATAIWHRTARNLKSRLVFSASSTRSAREVADEFALAA